MTNSSDQDFIKQPGQQRTLLTIVGDSASIDGKFKISQAIEIDCELKGKLNVEGKITIQKNGKVVADVATNEAEIIGRYEGNLEATGNVEIKETGIAVGNIKTDSLIINKGGIFSGNVSRITEEQHSSKKKLKSEQDSDKEAVDVKSEQDSDKEAVDVKSEQDSDKEAVDVKSEQDSMETSTNDFINSLRNRKKYISDDDENLVL